MEIIKTELTDAYIIEPKVFGDHRGWFMESYNKKAFEELGITTDFIQDNRSFSMKKGTLRGLHCQKGASAQTKLVSCVNGKVMDVIVDIREGSPSFMKWTGVELSAENKRMLYVPVGFLHGFVTLSDNVEFSYKVDNYYCAADDRSIKYNDKMFGVDWKIENPVLSEKDMNAPLYSESDVRFFYGKSTVNV